MNREDFEESARQLTSSAKYITPNMDNRYGDYLVSGAGKALLECNTCGGHQFSDQVMSTATVCISCRTMDDFTCKDIRPPEGMVENPWYVPHSDMKAYKNALWC